MNNGFYALCFRQRYIKRWGLMHSLYPESLSEHTCDVAVLTHALCTIGNEIYKKNYDVGKAVQYALFHDLPEVLTGDLPTPVKYFSDETKVSYKKVETKAKETLLSKLPPEVRDEYKKILFFEEDRELAKIVKCADRLSALIKCIEEGRAGNSEFKDAKKAIEKSLGAYDCPELDYFAENILPSFEMTLDELKENC